MISMLRKEDIGYYGARVTTFSLREKRQLRNIRSETHKSSKNYRINGLEAIEIEYYFEGNKKKVRERARVLLKDVYPEIKHVYDYDGILIGRRIQRGAPLKPTGKGMSKFLRYEN
uniref:type IV conjugative transfer system protein TraE n=1 Tax=Enterococcus faecalis TaxID=1351 RepID=UPI00359C4DCA